MMLCLNGQSRHNDEATADFPAAPKGQVFCIKRAKDRRNMMNHGLGIISIFYLVLNGHQQQ